MRVAATRPATRRLNGCQDAAIVHDEHRQDRTDGRNGGQTHDRYRRAKDRRRKSHNDEQHAEAIDSPRRHAVHRRDDASKRQHEHCRGQLHHVAHLGSVCCVRFRVLYSPVGWVIEVSFEMFLKSDDQWGACR